MVSISNFTNLTQYVQIHTTLHQKHSHRIYHTVMMTSSNGNIFPITAHLCGEFTGHRWIPRTKASDAELWYILWSFDLRPNKRLSKQSCGWWFETHRAHYDVTVMVPSILKYKEFITAWKYRFHNAPSALQGRHNGRDGSQIASFTIVYLTLNSGTDQRKHQSSASMAIVRWLVNSPHKWPVTREMFPFDDIFMCNIGKVLYHNWPSCSGVASFCSISTYNETQHF